MKRLELRSWPSHCHPVPTLPLPLHLHQVPPGSHAHWKLHPPPSLWVLQPGPSLAAPVESLRASDFAELFKGPWEEGRRGGQRRAVGPCLGRPSDSPPRGTCFQDLFPPSRILTAQGSPLPPFPSSRITANHPSLKFLFLPFSFFHCKTYSDLPCGSFSVPHSPPQIGRASCRERVSSPV